MIVGRRRQWPFSLSLSSLLCWFVTKQSWIKSYRRKRRFCRSQFQSQSFSLSLCQYLSYRIVVVHLLLLLLLLLRPIIITCHQSSIHSDDDSSFECYVNKHWNKKRKEMYNKEESMCVRKEWKGNIRWNQELLAMKMKKRIE